MDNGMDTGMEKRIFDALARDRRINMAELEVGFRNGTAILKGAVTSEQLRSAAEAEAMEVTGVERVENRLLVVPEYPYAEVDGPQGF